MLCSRMLDSLKSRSTAIEITAAGIDADTVSPANMPRYAFAPASTADSSTPSTSALTVSCGSKTAFVFTAEASMQPAHQPAQRLGEHEQHEARAHGREYDLRIEPGPIGERVRVERAGDDASDRVAERGTHEPHAHHL